MKTQRISLLTFSLFMTGLASAAPYTVTDLGTLGGSYSVAYGINDSGVVVGHSSGATTTDADGNSAPAFLAHAFRYDGSVMHDLGYLGNNVSYGKALNSVGDVVGYTQANVGTSDAPVYVNRAFVFQGSSMQALSVLTELGTPETTSQMSASGINDNNLIVGSATIVTKGSDGATTTLPQRAFIYDRINNSYTLVPQFSSDYSGAITAAAINSQNVVVGVASKKIGDNLYASRAYRYDMVSNTMTDLGSFNDSASFATGINTAGKVVGGSYVKDLDIGGGSYLNHAFLYDPGVSTNLIDLGYLSKQRAYSSANGINDHDQIVGVSTFKVSYDASGSTAMINHAILSQVSDGARKLYDLNTLISCDDQKKWLLSEANAINNNGQIVGVGSINGEAHAFLLTPPAGEFSGTAPTCETPDSGSSSGGGGGSFGLGLVSLLAAGAAIRRKL